MKSIYGSEIHVLPDEFASIKPGSKWCWEPLKIESRCYIEVLEIVKKLDDQWWILCLAVRDGGGIRKGTTAWNELSRFIEAAVLIEPAK